MAIKTRSNRTTPIVASKIAPIILITTPLPRTEPILYRCCRAFKCKACHRQFSATSGNLLACRKLPFRTLFTGIPQIAADFSLISSQTGVSDKRESLKLSRSWKFVRLGRHCQRYSVCRSGNMPYRALGLIVSITGVAVLALFSLPKPAHAHCAKVGNDDTVRTIPRSLIAGAATLFHEPANEAASQISLALKATRDACCRVSPTTATKIPTKISCRWS